MKRTALTVVVPPSVPPLGSVLRCVEGPAVGGDTIWVNMAEAYRRLPARLQLDPSVHVCSHSGGRAAEARQWSDHRPVEALRTSGVVDDAAHREGRRQRWLAPSGSLALHQVSREQAPRRRLR